MGGSPSKKVPEEHDVGLMRVGVWAGAVEREGPPRSSLTHTQQAAEVLDWGLGEIWKSSMSLGWQNHWLYAGLSDGTGKQRA